MNIQNAISESVKTGKLIKRKIWNNWVKVKGKYLYEEGDDSGISIAISIDDILADDWQVEEKWFDGDFEKKYPNGVLCKVSSGKFGYNLDVIIGYCNKNTEYSFKGYHGDYKYALPISSNELPFVKLPSILIRDNEVINVKDIVKEYSENEHK